MFSLSDSPRRGLGHFSWSFPGLFVISVEGPVLCQGAVFQTTCFLEVSRIKLLLAVPGKKMAFGKHILLWGSETNTLPSIHSNLPWESLLVNLVILLGCFLNNFQECSALSHSQLLNICSVWTADPSLFLYLFPAYFNFSTLDRTIWSALKPKTLLPPLLPLPDFGVAYKEFIILGYFCVDKDCASFWLTGDRLKTRKEMGRKERKSVVPT